MAIQVRDLTKRYGAHLAVDDISFEVDDGSVFAFVGTNGAGKSTTIGCLTTVLPFDSGDVRVLGYDVAHDGERVRERIGVVFQDSVLDPILTARENLRLRARLAGVAAERIDDRIGRMSALIDMDDFLDRRYGTLSGGQRRRVDVARALLHEPRIIFLDEPTAGLDPASRALVWRTLHELRSRGDLTIFLTTHYLEETEEADRVCIVDGGHIVADDTPARLRAAHSRSVLTVRTDDPAALVAAAGEVGAVAAHEGELLVIQVPDAGTARRLLVTHGDRVRDFEFRHGRMDDVFLALTGHQAVPA